jgi:dUTP pyrophosphatase
MQTIKIINQSKHAMPAYETVCSAGMDIRANIEEDVLIKPLERKLVPTGLYFELPQGFEAQIRPRSGIAYKHGVTVLNSPGTIDADYRGEVKVLLINLSPENFVIKDGERIAQIIIAKYEQVNLQEVNILEETKRGAAGFGSTGKN